MIALCFHSLLILIKSLTNSHNWWFLRRFCMKKMQRHRSNSSSCCNSTACCRGWCLGGFFSCVHIVYFIPPAYVLPYFSIPFHHWWFCLVVQVLILNVSVFAFKIRLRDFLKILEIPKLVISNICKMALASNIGCRVIYWLQWN